MKSPGTYPTAPVIMCDQQTLKYDFTPQLPLFHSVMVPSDTESMFSWFCLCSFQQLKVSLLLDKSVIIRMGSSVIVLLCRHLKKKIILCYQLCVAFA